MVTAGAGQCRDHPERAGAVHLTDPAGSPTLRIPVTGSNSVFLALLGFLFFYEEMF